MPQRCPGRAGKAGDTWQTPHQGLRTKEAQAGKHVQSLALTNIRAPGRLQEQYTAQFPRGLAQHGGWTGASPVG